MSTAPKMPWNAQAPVEPGTGLRDIWQSAGDPEFQSSLSIVVQLVQQAFLCLWRSPLTSVVAMTTTAITTALLGVVMVVLTQVGGLLYSQGDRAALHVFLNDTATTEQRQQLEKLLVTRFESAELQFVSKKEALDDFLAMVGEEAAKAVFADQNPLPASFKVSLMPSETLPEQLKALRAAVEVHEAVESVQFSTGLASTLARLASRTRQAAYGIGALLLVISSFLVLAITTLSIYNREDELSIMRLVGATTWSIRLPFLIEGSLLGFLGASLGLVCTWGLVQAIEASGFDLLQLLGAQAEFGFLGYSEIVGLLALGVGVGAFGSLMAVRNVSQR